MSNIQEVVTAWKEYVAAITDWKKLVASVEPKQGGCGLVYELPSPIDRPNESVAIADMTDLEVAEPHYHPDGVTEIYIVLEGLGLTVVGGKEQQVAPGDVVVTPPNTAHFTIPDSLVLAVINTPPFQEGDYISLTNTDERVLFDRTQFERLTA